MKFCETIENAGYNAGYYGMIYADKNRLDNYLYADEILKDFDLRLSHRNVERPVYFCGIWRYSSTGKIDRINGNVDLNISCKNYTEIVKNRGLNRFRARTN